MTKKEYAPDDMSFSARLSRGEIGEKKKSFGTPGGKAPLGPDGSVYDLKYGSLRPKKRPKISWEEAEEARQQADLREGPETLDKLFGR